MGSIIIDHTPLNNISWKHFETASRCDSFIGEKISGCIENEKSQSILLLLSGGSSFAVFDSIHASNWNNITITMLDERFEENNAHNNFSQLENTEWYRQVKENGATFISTKIEPGETQEKTAQKWENSLKQWTKENPNGSIIALFGIGPDGHTAGIFPSPENQQTFDTLFLNDHFVTSYDASGKNEFPLRITTTHTFHKLISHAYISLKGEEKQQMFKKFIKNETPLHELPAKILFSLPDVTIAINF
jgi:6-phosphogluconolactonase/glucosamine-6-phosphate isomerase/deaminase